MTERPLRIAFVHPDLGIGGAERLVVDAATGLQARGHQVTVYTSHHDASHCFEETRDGTLKLRVRGNTVPVTIFGYFFILCSILRSLQLAVSLLLDSDKYDVVFCDQQSASIPLLRWSKAKIFFYCHHPDKLLTERNSLLRKIYRIPFDMLEEWTTGMADMIVVNSLYTKSIFHASFRNLTCMPHVLHPGIHLVAYDKTVEENHPKNTPLKTNRKVILSINRFERKKNIALAISAFGRLRNMRKTNAGNIRLIVAGGYDTRVRENVEHHRELEQLARRSDLSTFTIWGDSDIVPNDVDVVFLPSFSEEQRTYLFHLASCLVYTPSNEHFGIVPVEAMFARLPVVAINSGGPRETILDGKTGILCDPDENSIAEALHRLLFSRDVDLKEMGVRGRDHVQKSFSLEKFAENLEHLLTDLVHGKMSSGMSSSAWSPFFCIAGAFAAACFLICLYLLFCR